MAETAGCEGAEQYKQTVIDVNNEHSNAVRSNRGNTSNILSTFAQQLSAVLAIGT